MPKMKTHRGTAKRVRTTGTGKLVRGSAGGHSHFLEKKSPKRKRKLDGQVVADKADEKVLKRNLGLR